MSKNRNAICLKCGKKMKRCTCRSRKATLKIYILAGIILLALVLLALNKEKIKKPSISPQTEFTEDESRANTELEWLLVHHPDEEVRCNLDSLIRNVIISLATRTSFPVEEIQFDYTFEPHGVLVYNPGFLLDTLIPDEYKFLVLRHEYEHIKDYFAGKLWKGGKEPKTDKEKYEFAKITWETENKAVKAEVELAIRIKAEQLIPDLCKKYKTGGTEFNDYLLWLILNSSNSPYARQVELHPYFRKIAAGG